MRLLRVRRDDNIEAIGAAQHAGCLFEALMRRPERALVHIDIAQDQHDECWHSAKPDRPAPQIGSAAGKIERQYHHKPDQGGGKPGRRPQVHVFCLAERCRVFGDKAEGDRKIETDADPHQQAEQDQHPVVRGKRRSDCRDHKEEQVEQKHAQPADLVDIIAAKKSAKESADRHRGGDCAEFAGRQVKLLAQLDRADAEAGKVIGVDECPADRDKDDREPRLPDHAPVYKLDDILAAAQDKLRHWLSPRIAVWRRQ